MARVLVEIPRVGLVMESARLLRWLKAVGDKVSQGDPLVEIETEKSVVEIESAVDGHLAESLVQAEQEVAVGAPIAWVEDGRAETTAAPGREAAAAPPPAPAAPVASPAAKEAAGERVRSSPASRRLAEQLGVDLTQVKGSGPGGRVQVEDVERAAGQRQPPAQPQSGLSTMRRMVARVMTLSNATVPQFTVTRTVDWTEVQSLRKSPATGGVALSANDFLMQAVARALIEFPALNGIFVGDPNSPDACIEPAAGAHIGLVVAVPDGMLVPVFHDVEKMGLKALARARTDLVERARAGRLRQEEASGATFSISNLGAQGPDQFIAIINPPESGILAAGRMQDLPVVRDGVVTIRPVSQLSLTMDHRLADDKLAAEFLGRVVQILEGGDWAM